MSSSNSSSTAAGRPRRSTAGNKFPTRQKKKPKVPSTSHYLGYVEDDESVESIMKKFQALEEYKQQVGIDDKKGKGNDDELPFTDNQLEDVFKITSSLQVQMALEEEEFQYMLEADDFDDEFEEDSDSESEDDEAFWEAAERDEEREKEPRKSRKGTGAKEGRAKKDRSIRQHHSTLPLEITDADGYVYAVKRKQKAVDPTLPQYIRIPNSPLPRSWCRSIKPYDPDPFCSSPATPTPPGARFFEANILDLDLEQELKGDFIAILLSPTWKLATNLQTLGSKGNGGFLQQQEGIEYDDQGDPNAITPADLARLRITEKLIPFGYIFIWVEKEWIPEVVEVLRKWNFFYVENFVWVKKWVDNTYAAQGATYFQRAKLSLLIFKRNTDRYIELRHQRNPDVEIDFVRRTEFGVEDKPEFAYHVIETLLPTAGFSETTGRGQLLELWTPRKQQRKGWTMIAQRRKLKDASQ